MLRVRCLPGPPRLALAREAPSLPVGPRAAEDMWTPDGAACVPAGILPRKPAARAGPAANRVLPEDTSDLASRFNRDDFKMKVPVSAHFPWERSLCPGHWAGSGEVDLLGLQRDPDSPPHSSWHGAASGSCQLSWKAKAVQTLSGCSPGKLRSLGEARHAQSGS